MNKKHLKWIIPALFVVITAIFFYKAFLGYSMEGTDSSLGVMSKAAPQAGHVVDYWMDDFWIGIKQNMFAVNIYTFALQIFTPDMVQFVTYSLAILLALIFGYLFLRKLYLSPLPAVFGAIAFAFTPHFITLSTAAHITVIEMVAYPPMIFYFLTILFDPEENDHFKKWVSLAMAGIAWSIMLTNDIQRGLYFSVPAAVYVVFLLLRKNEVKFKNLAAKITEKNFLMDVGRTVLLLLVFLLSFSSGMKGWLDVLKTRNVSAPAVQQVATEEAKWNTATSWSFHPLELIDSFAFGYHGKMSYDAKSPYWGSFDYAGSSVSLGLFVILFALIGFFAYYKKSFTVKFFFWAGLVALILSFGRFLPGTPFFWLFYNLPVMGGFRAPTKFLAVTAFAAAILAAYGLEFILDLIRRELKENRVKVIDNITKLIGVFLGLGVIWTLYCLISWNDIAYGIGQQLRNQDAGQKAVATMVNALLRMLVFTALNLGIFLAVRRFREKKWSLPFAGIAFIVLLTVELWNINWFYMDKAYFKADKKYVPDPVIQTLMNNYRTEIFRVSTTGFTPNLVPYPLIDPGLKMAYIVSYFPFFKVQSMDYASKSSTIVDYDTFWKKLVDSSGITELRTLDDLVEMNLRVYRMANVKYLLSQQPLSNANIVLTNTAMAYNGRETYIYYVKDYLPRVGFFGDAIPVQNNDDALAYISDGKFPIGSVLVVNGPAGELGKNPQPVIPQRITAYLPWKVSVAVNAPADGWVLFNTKYEPDWKAYVDGKKTPTYRANYLEIGMPVKQGMHTVEFKYEPAIFEYMVSLFTFIAGLLAAAAYGATKLIPLLNRKKQG